MDITTFLSYSRKDGSFARWLHNGVEAEGIIVWWDQEQQPGIPWPTQVDRWIECAHAVVVIFSSHSAKSDAVICEILVARDDHKRHVIPILLGDGTGGLRVLIAHLHWIDARNRLNPIPELLNVLHNICRNNANDTSSDTEDDPPSSPSSNDGPSTPPAPSSSGDDPPSPPRIGGSLPPPPPGSRFTRITMVRARDIADFDEDEQISFRYILARVARIALDLIRIVGIRPGSVRVTLELPESTAHWFVELFQRRDPLIELLDITDIILDTEVRLAANDIIRTAQPAEEEKMTGNIVISYSHKDEAYVKDLEERLNRELSRYRLAQPSDTPGDSRPRVWIYPGQPIGEAYYREIMLQIEAALALIVVLSEDSAQSEWVLREINFAVARKRLILPIATSDVNALQGTPVGFALGVRKWIAISDGLDPIPEIIRTLQERDLLVKALIGESYILDKRLSSGGQGSVFESTSTRDDTPVIVKDVISSDKEILRELDAKVQRLRELRHVALPRVLDYLQEDGRRYLVMEFVPGENLRDALVRRGRKPFPVDDVLHWSEQILETLSFMHANGVFHHGINPQNLKRTRENAIKLLDLGFDRRPKHISATDLANPYLAPEQRDEREADARTDIYALGATMYTLLTGEERPSHTQTPVHQRNPEVPEPLSQAIMKAMDPEPSQRFATTRAMLRALEVGVVASTAQPVARSPISPISDPPAVKANPPVTPPARPAEKKMGLLWFSGGALVVVLLALLGLLAINNIAATNTPTATPAAQTAAPAATTAVAATSTEPAPTAAPPTIEPPTAAPLAPTTAPGIVVPPLPPVGDNVVRIVVAGPFGSENTDFQKKAEGGYTGAQLAAEKFASLLQAKGLSLKIEQLDDQANSARAKALADTVVADPAALCVVGHFNSSTSIDAGRVYGDNKLLMISPSSSNPAVTAPQTVWRLVATDDKQAEVAVQVARNSPFNAGSVAIVHVTTDAGGQPDDYGNRLVKEFRQNANQLQIVGAYGFSRQGSVDFGSIVAELKALSAPPKMIFFVGTAQELSQFISEVQNNWMTNVPPILGADTLDSPQQVAELRAAGHTIAYTTMAAPLSTLDQTFKAQFGGNPPAYAAEGYDATYFCMRAVIEAAPGNGARPTREQVAQAMQNIASASQQAPIPIGPEATVAGPYIFNPDTRNLAKSVVILQTVDNQSIVYDCRDSQRCSVR